MTNLLDAALSYAARGWPVLPCKPNKAPLTAHGVHDATDDPETIRAWWSRWPEAAVALACGPSGLVVIDCDVDGDVDGIREWEALGIDDSGALHSLTPSGGLHCLFAAGGASVGNSAGKLAPGVDVRANGGYIIAPPSHIDAGDYVAADDWDRDPAPLPMALFHLLAPPRPAAAASPAPRRAAGAGTSKYGAAALDAELDAVARAAEGTRNEALNRAAFNLGQLVAGHEIDARDAEDGLLDAAHACGLVAADGERAVLATINSGLTAGKRDPRGAPTPATITRGAPPLPEPPPEHDGTLYDDAPEVLDAPRYTLHTAAEALAPQPPIVWVIDELFSEGSVSLLVGDPGTAKTYSLLDAAVCVAVGDPWLTYATTPAPVLVIDEESGPRRIARRLGDCLRGHDGGPEAPLFYTTLDRFNLLNGDDVEALHAAIEETGARFVVIDALVDVMPGGDENAVSDVQPVFIALRTIAAATGAAIVVIHHNNKAGSYRGSSAMHGAIDTQISLTKSGGDITFDIKKRRDGEPFKFGAVGYWEPARFWLVATELTEARPVFNKSEDYVLRYLTKHGPSELSAIIGHADVCSEGSAKNAVYALTGKGVCERVDKGGQGMPATYGLTEYGLDVA